MHSVGVSHGGGTNACIAIKILVIQGRSVPRLILEQQILPRIFPSCFSGLWFLIENLTHDHMLLRRIRICLPNQTDGKIPDGNICILLAAMLKRGKNLCTATCPNWQSWRVLRNMNPCEKILAEMNPVIRAYHTDRWLSEETTPRPEENRDLLLIPACITLLFATWVIAFFVWPAGRGDGQRISTWCKRTDNKTLFHHNTECKRSNLPFFSQISMVAGIILNNKKRV